MGFESRKRLAQNLPLVLRFRFSSFFQGGPGGRLGHRVDYWGAHMQSEQLGAEALGYFCCVRDGGIGGRREIGEEKNVLQLNSSASVESFHFVPPSCLASYYVWPDRDCSRAGKLRGGCDRGHI